MQDKELKGLVFACIDKLRGSDVSRLSIQNGDFSLTIEKQGATAAVPPQSAPDALTENKPIAETGFIGTVVPAPLVGTFYAAAAPEEPPMVQPGDTVKRGDVLCIIEAMKIMNNIESPCDGVVRRVLVTNGDLVEYNQPLFEIEE